MRAWRHIRVVAGLVPAVHALLFARRPAPGVGTTAGLRGLGLILALPLASCSGWQSALDPQGPQAEALAGIIWLFTIVCTVVFVLVMLVLAIALMRRHASRPDPLVTDARREKRMLAVIGGAIGVTLLTVLALTAVSYSGQRFLFTKAQAAVNITLTGNQWWWDIQYDDPRPDRTFVTANEIYVPVGEPVLLKLRSNDVIHSFWVPSLAGKMDLIPGQDNELQFTAARPGTYRGQCAEFCGYQHAHMGLLVVAVPKAEFDAWRDAQLKPAETPSDPERKKGQDIFLSKPCFMCHAVRGTPAGGRTAPDLTHIGSRKYLAAATLPMTRGSLGAWMVDPQSIKPGAHMPTMNLEPGEIEPLLSYLEGLK
jgi:cytochrome c oxidase subunit 2